MSTFRVELTSDQMYIIKMAVDDAARWYREYGRGDPWYEQREQENLALRAYLDLQIPAETSNDAPPKE